MFTPADIISVYSRADAIADGQLLDVSETARMFGFIIPVAVTNSVWVECVQGGAESTRLEQLLLSAVRAVLSNKNESLTEFSVECPSDTQDGAPSVTHRLFLMIGPGDDPAPVMTIMTPEDY